MITTGPEPPGTVVVVDVAVVVVVVTDVVVLVVDVVDVVPPPQLATHVTLMS